MFTLPLSKEQFVDALHKGQGRALMHVQEYGDAGLEDAITEVMLRDPTYDIQIEGRRTEWMMNFVEASPRRDMYFDTVLDALETLAADSDVETLCNYAWVIASCNDSRARALLYRTFDQARVGAEEIVNLDGLSGLTFVAERYGDPVQTLDGWPHENWRSSVGPEWLVEMAEQVISKDAVQKALADSASSSTYAKAFLADVDQWRKPAERAPRKSSTISEILVAADRCEGSGPYKYSNFGIHATQSEIEIVFNRILGENRDECLTRLLWVFQKRPMPRVEEKVLNLVRSSHERVRVAASWALRHNDDPRLRKFGLEMLANHSLSQTFGSEVLYLFESRFESSDALVIERALNAGIIDTTEAHILGSAVCDIADAQPAPELVGCLLWVYRTTPCSNCRERAVSHLIDRRAAPDWLIEECVFDCAEDIRKLVSEKSA